MANRGGDAGPPSPPPLGDLTPPVRLWRLGWIPAPAEREPVREAMRHLQVHLGSWRAGLSTVLAVQLPIRLADMASPTWEFLPVADTRFRRSWGYSGASYSPLLGAIRSPDDFFPLPGRRAVISRDPA